eukprot:Hpha_TRINITY_DN4422_c0_g1::TRINITY_DN4422_c0_g1_i1::g.50420::m.50420/K15104/SLC25A11, OGC; solute carrier family 25 (mitochondrial oxoglutarate transporter), member 11
MGLKTKEPWQGLVCAAGGCLLADFSCTPLDVVKVRLQLSRSGVLGETYSGVIECVQTIARNEGLPGFFKGLSPALLRAVTYGSTRVGLYEPIKKAIGGESTAPPSLLVKLVSGLSSGALASFLFNPCDVVKVRMQGDRLGTRYPRLLPAFQQIAREEGLAGLYRGASATVGRAATCACAELVTYDESKRALMGNFGWADSLKTHFCASMVAGLVSTIASNPIDVVKARMMNQPVAPDGTPTLYRNPIDCLTKTVQKEGFMGLYAGFGPSYIRLGPHTMLIFVSVEQIRHGMGWAVS